MHVDIARDRSLLAAIGTPARGVVPCAASAPGGVRIRGVHARGPWLRLLAEVIALAGPHAELLRHADRPWQSATFTGARHTVVLAFAGSDAIDHGEAFVAALPEHEFTIAGQIVADATVVGVDHAMSPALRMTVTAELLLLEDA